MHVHNQMSFIVTEHAKKRCVRRNIQPEWIKNALNFPVRIECDSDDGSLLHAIWPVPEKGYRVLRVIYNGTVNPVAVVTAYFDNEVIAP